MEEAGGMNLYAFVGNNPLSWADPLGLAYGDTFDVRTYLNTGFFEGLWIGTKNVGKAVVTLVKSPYTITKSLSSAAGTLSTEYGREQLAQRLGLMAQLVKKYAEDSCFRYKVNQKLGEQAKDYFTDPYKLSELFANIGVNAAFAANAALGAAGTGVSEAGGVVEELTSLLGEASSEAKVVEEAAEGAASGEFRFQRWKRGDAIDKPLPNGDAPDFGTVQSRYWKNRYEASKDTGEFSPANLRRMDRGSAPKDFNPRTGQWEPRELHHVNAQRFGGSDAPLNLRELTPDWHGEVDPSRIVPGIQPTRGIQ